MKNKQKCDVENFYAEETLVLFAGVIIFFTYILIMILITGGVK